MGVRGEGEGGVSTGATPAQPDMSSGTTRGPARCGGGVVVATVSRLVKKFCRFVACEYGMDIGWCLGGWVLVFLVGGSIGVAWGWHASGLVLVLIA